MITRPACVCIAAALTLAVAERATAQASRFEISSGYQFIRAGDQELPIGWSADIATDLDKAWSIVGEVSGAYRVQVDEDLGVDVRLALHFVGAGPRWSRRAGSRIVPFLQMLAGAARVSAIAEILNTKIGDSSTKFMLQPGGGVNLKVNDAFGIVGQMDYRRVLINEGGEREPGQNQFRVLVGVRIGL